MQRDDFATARGARRAPTTLVLALVLALAACAAPAAKPPASGPSPHYPGTCALVGIDEVPAPSEENSDSVAMVARYRFGGPSRETESPWALQFQVARARKHDLRLHLEAHPNVVCSPEDGASPPEKRRIDVPPFEGQQGQAVP